MVRTTPSLDLKLPVGWPAAFLLLALAIVASAQTSTGGVQGRVWDPQGRAIAEAEIKICSRATNVVRSATAASDGAFRVEGLQPGEYDVEATAIGFAATRMRMEVTIGQVATVELHLSVAGGMQTVEVRERENTPDTSTVTVGSPVTEREIQQVPLANRSFANIAYIAPMTAPVEPSDPTKARITAVSFAGSSGLNVDLSVDGGDNNDDWIGGFLQNYSPESIREFNVRTAQFEADTSRTNGGSVILSTRSGTNEWHGSLSGFFRATDLNARNELDNPEPNPKQPYGRQDLVGTFGGPIARDKLWFFTSYEFNRENGSVAYSAESLAQFGALAQMAAAGQIPGVATIDVPTSVPEPFRDHIFNARLDWAQSERSRWFLRFSLDRQHASNDLVAQGALPSTGFTTRSNYYTVLAHNQLLMGSWIGSLTLQASLFDHDKLRNSELGFALAFPFSSTTLTTTGFETFGDNQFLTEITAFPIRREQQKYQVRYDVTRAGGRHTPKFGVNLIHEPVLSGRFADSAERLIQFTANPDFFLASAQSIAPFFTCDAGLASPGPPPACPLGATVTMAPAANGRFSQNIQRLGLYAQDSWRATPHLVLDYGVRYDTTFGLFVAEGREQNANPALAALQAAGVAFASGIPHDYRGAVAPRLGIAYSPGAGNTVLRAGFGLYFNDLAQNGWAQAFQAVNGGPNPPSAIIDPHYHAPYAIEISAAVERAIGNEWTLALQLEHQGGLHQYRRYEYVSGITLPAAAPDVSVFRSDNRSSYNGGSLVMKHRGRRYDLTAHYTFARATTWGATVGELFDYVNGVSNPLNPFGPGDHGPSGEDIRHRFVLAAVVQLPAGFEVSTLAQAESARPYTLATPVDVNGDGDPTNDRAVVNGVQTSLDQFRGTPYAQVDLRVSRLFRISDGLTVQPFAEFFNLFNRQNPGNNFVGDIAALGVNDPANATALCLDAACALTQPITSLNQLRVPAGALGDFFGPGTTVGIPFAAQFGFRLQF